jgi:hypothetical protein
MTARSLLGSNALPGRTLGRGASSTTRVPPYNPAPQRLACAEYCHPRVGTDPRRSGPIRHDNLLKLDAKRQIDTSIRSEAISLTYVVPLQWSAVMPEISLS